MEHYMEQKIVTIFGGSKCRDDSEEYSLARKLGGLLARAGFTVCTGGYLGVMEAASRGAHEQGGRVLGIVMNQFKNEPNRYLTDKVATEHFYERLQHLITRSVAFIALRGGMGTVTELSLVWNKLQTRVIEPRPLILLGACWKPLLECWRRYIVISDEDMRTLDFALTADEALEIIMKKAPPLTAVSVTVK